MNLFPYIMAFTIAGFLLLAWRDRERRRNLTPEARKAEDRKTHEDLFYW